jgi:NADPH-dependent curcumin reductase CurA
MPTTNATRVLRRRPVGSMVGQIDRIHGCRVVGIAGSDDKCRRLRETAGFDAAINHRSEEIGAMAGWLLAGKLHLETDIVHGLENAPASLERLFSGRNLGKLVVQVSAEP